MALIQQKRKARLTLRERAAKLFAPTPALKDEVNASVRLRMDAEAAPPKKIVNARPFAGITDAVLRSLSNDPAEIGERRLEQLMRGITPRPRHKTPPGFEEPGRLSRATVDRLIAEHEARKAAEADRDREEQARERLVQPGTRSGSPLQNYEHRKLY
jgi:hypothetical protein